MRVFKVLSIESISPLEKFFNIAFCSSPDRKKKGFQDLLARLDFADAMRLVFEVRKMPVDRIEDESVMPGAAFRNTHRQNTKITLQ